jgi:hypothetical protein
MVGFLAAFIVLIVPAIAAWTWKPENSRRLWTLAAASILLLAVLALGMASPRFGNRLSESEGYWTVATRILGLFALTGALPILCSVAFISVAGGKLHRALVFAIAAVISIAAWFIGIFMSLYVQYR